MCAVLTWTMRVYQQPVQEVCGGDVNCEETVVSDNDVIQPQEGDPVRSVSLRQSPVWSPHLACDVQKAKQTKQTKQKSRLSTSSVLVLASVLALSLYVQCTGA